MNKVCKVTFFMLNDFLKFYKTERLFYYLQFSVDHIIQNDIFNTFLFLKNYNY